MWTLRFSAGLRCDHRLPAAWPLHPTGTRMQYTIRTMTWMGSVMAIGVLYHQQQRPHHHLWAGAAGAAGAAAATTMVTGPVPEETRTTLQRWWQGSFHPSNPVSKNQRRPQGEQSRYREYCPPMPVPVLRRHRHHQGSQRQARRCNQLAEASKSAHLVPFVAVVAECHRAHRRRRRRCCRQPARPSPVEVWILQHPHACALFRSPRRRPAVEVESVPVAYTQTRAAQRVSTRRDHRPLSTSCGSAESVAAVHPTATQSA